MERSIDLTSLAALPLDAGILGVRRSTPATNDDPELFRQHLDAPRTGADNDKPQETKADVKPAERRERATSRTDAKRKPETRPAKAEQNIAADETTPRDDARPAAEGPDDPTAAEPTDSAPNDAAQTANELKEKEAAEAEAIVEEVTAIVVAAPVEPVTVETTHAESSVDAPAVEPISQIAPAAPQQAENQAVPAPLPVEVASHDDAAPEANPADEAKALAIKARDEAAAAQPAKTSPKPETKLAEVETAKSPDADSSNEKSTSTEPTAAATDEVTVKEADAESKDDDASDDRPRKTSVAKVNASQSEGPDPTPDSNSTPKTTVNHATTNNTPSSIAPPVGIAAAAEKLAASASQSAAPRGVGSVESSAPQRLPQHLVGKPGEATGGEPKLSEAEQVRLMQRVARAFQTAQQRDGEIRIRLSPPELGSLKLEIKVHDGVMTARAEAETHAAQQLLIDNLPALRERLAEQNIRLEQFDVSLPGRQSQGQPESRDSQPGASGSRGGLAGRERESGAAAESLPAATRHHDGKLNVFI